MSADYRRRRVMTFLDPWSDPLGDGFQIIQSLIAVGTGGVFGKGLMEGVQKLFYLPEPHTDFIFAVIGEELGLIGATAVLSASASSPGAGCGSRCARRRLVRLVRRARADVMIAVQALINMSVVLGLMPNKGIPAAARQLRRFVAADQPARHGRAAEHLAARDRLTDA